MKDVIVIGVDHGYAAMKAVHFSFPTGLVEYEHEPYTQKDRRTTICSPWQPSPRNWSIGVRSTPPASTWPRACP